MDPEGQYDPVINLQGDLPTLDPELIRQVARPLADPAVDMATLAVEIRDRKERGNPNVVKVAADSSARSPAKPRAPSISAAARSPGRVRPMTCRCTTISASMLSGGTAWHASSPCPQVPWKNGKS